MNKFYTLFFIGILIVISGLLIFLYYSQMDPRLVTVKNDNNNNDKSQNNTAKPSIVPAIETKPELSYIPLYAVSPLGSVYARLVYMKEGVQNEKVQRDPHMLYLEIFPVWSGISSSKTGNLDLIDCVLPQKDIDIGRGYWSESIDPDGPYYSLLSSAAAQKDYIDQNILVWSPDGLNVGFLSQDGVYVYRFQRQYSVQGTYGICNQALVLIDTLKIPLEIYNDVWSSKIAYSGDSSELYIQAKEFYRYSLREKQLIPIELSDRDGSYFFTIPRSRGIVYSAERRTGEGGYNTITLNFWDHEERYNLSDEDTDGIDNIVLSPDRKHVCIDQHASGSHWYGIYELTTKKLVASTGTYSYCKKWLTNKEIIVEESEYNSGVKASLLLNISTGKRVVLDN